MERIKSVNNLTDQQKGSLMAFVAVMFITPDSLFIRLSNVDTWGLVFYRGIIPFVTVFVGMLFIYKSSFFKLLYGNSIYGAAYIPSLKHSNEWLRGSAPRWFDRQGLLVPDLPEWYLNKPWSH